MNKLKKVVKVLLDKDYRFNILSSFGFYSNISDEQFLKRKFKSIFGYDLNLDNPITYSEKIQWLKLYDRNPEYTKMVDKFLVKDYVEKKIGVNYIIPTLGVWESFDEIEFEKLPNQFVLKTTHDSGGVVICTDKSKFNKKKARKKLNKSLKNNYYSVSKEWPYKNVIPRIIAEEYMVDESGYELKDYKFFCFNGKVKAMFIASNRQGDGETKFDFYDEKFNHLPFTNGHPNSLIEIKKPSSFDEMIILSEKLSTNIPHVRVDFYDVNGKVYFGELTFYHWEALFLLNHRMG